MVPEIWLKTVVYVGDFALYTLIVLCLMLISYCFLNQNLDAPSLYCIVKTWPSETQEQLGFVSKYYFGGLFTLTFCSLVACLCPPILNYIRTHYIITTITTTLGLFLSMLFVHNFSYREKFREKLFFFIMHCVLTTPTICSIGIEICIRAAIYTMLLMAFLVAVALIAHENFHLSLTGPLTKINGVIVASSILLTVIGTPKSAVEIAILCINMHLGFFFFAGMFIVNVQLLIADCKLQDEKFDPIYTAAVMEISTLNLFLRMATLITLKLALTKSPIT